jgi:hypothetical protein
MFAFVFVALVATMLIGSIVLVVLVWRNRRR